MRHTQGPRLLNELALAAPVGEHTIAVRAVDDNDNVAVGKVVVK